MVVAVGVVGFAIAVVPGDAVVAWVRVVHNVAVVVVGVHNVAVAVAGRMDAVSAVEVPMAGVEEASEAVEDGSFAHHMGVGPREGTLPCR